VWLPLALSSIYAALFQLCRLWAANGGEMKVPPRSEILAAWMLPIMSSSLKASEEESDALALFESVKRLAEKKESGARGQGSGARGQGSKVRSQGSKVRSQGSKVRSQESGVRSQC